MTIGIGVLCHDGDCMILASDLRVSYSNSQGVVSKTDYAGKQWDLLPPFTGSAAVAGSMSLCHDFISELTARFDKLIPLPDFSIEQVENAINESRLHLVRRRLDWELTSKLHITLAELHEGKRRGKKLNDAVIQKGIEIGVNIPLNMQIILAGYWGPANRRKALWVRVDRKEQIECTPTPGFFVIGSGSNYARNHLAWRRQNLERKLPSSLLHVHEALIRARKDRHVGEPMPYVICWRDGRVERVNHNDPLLRTWSKHYKRRNDTSRLDIEPVARRQVDFILRGHDARTT